MNRIFELIEDGSFLLVLVLAALGFCAFASWGSYREYTTRLECNMLGYSNAQAYPFRGLYFCVSRVNQTDVIIPLAAARQRPQQ